MPLFRIKRVWDFCTYNKPFFLFILSIYLILNIIDDFVVSQDQVTFFIIQFIVSVVITGYGLIITRERINGGIRLPKIEVKDALYLGIKASIVLGVLLLLQWEILDYFSSLLHYPVFDLEELLLDFNEVVYLVFTHDLVHNILFFVFDGIVFYVTTFFLEIALARLADTGSLISAFDLLEIKKDIDIFGWRNYARDYTLIILAMTILTYLKLFILHISVLDYFIDVFLGLLIFATQFLGIGAVYSVIKTKKN